MLLGMMARRLMEALLTVTAATRRPQQVGDAKYRAAWGQLPHVARVHGLVARVNDARGRSAVDALVTTIQHGARGSQPGFALRRSHSGAPQRGTAWVGAMEHRWAQYGHLEACGRGRPVSGGCGMLRT